MKKTGQRWWLRNQHELNGFVEHIQGMWDKGEYPTVQFLESDRSTNQNTMMFALYGDIARALEDMTVVEVRRMCKLHYGIPIRRAADQEFSDWYDQAIRKTMSYEQKLLLMDHMDVTSEFTKAQATEYIDTILNEYAKQGIPLERRDA